MNRTYIFMATAGLVLGACAAWLWAWPFTPVDTPYFSWQAGEDDRYELVVSHIAGNPEFRRGVTTTPVPRSGTLRVSGTAEPGAMVEVSNPRTGRGYAATAGADGSFAIEAQAERGDALKVMSRKIEFRAVTAPRASVAH
ncbi:MAG: Ig-like domain-containing protein [Nevskiaceae bacterium]